jgi:DUF4097 and DUF4098 domain-containing protein YvlB
MRTLVAIIFCLALGSILALAPSHSRAKAFHEGDVTDQINKTVTLAPGSNVAVRGINGTVTIETWDGDRAEINISIKASDQAAMERRPIFIDSSSNSLTIRTEEDREGRRGGWDRGWVRHEVRVKMPKNVNLKISGVNGGVDVGAITGEVGLSGINGRVDVAQAGTASKLSGINGGVALALLSLGEGGLHVSGVNGGIEIGLPAALNAEIDVHSVNGGVSSDLPITVVGEMRRGEMRGRVGEGGPPITITGVNGGVKLRRN